MCTASETQISHPVQYLWEPNFLYSAILKDASVLFIGNTLICSEHLKVVVQHHAHQVLAITERPLPNRPERGWSNESPNRRALEGAGPDIFKPAMRHKCDLTQGGIGLEGSVTYFHDSIWNIYCA